VDPEDVEPLSPDVVVPAVSPLVLELEVSPDVVVELEVVLESPAVVVPT
jgi:hypothetical protein